MGKIKDRNGMDLTEAEDKARRDGKNIQRNCTKKDLNDRDNHDGVITHSEPDILEREIKWALGSSDAMKDSEGDGISAELFKILKDDAINVLHSIISANLGKPSRSHRTGKGQSSF